MQKGIILFDVDRTILDTDKMSSLRNEAILKILNTTDFEKVKSTKDSYRSTLKNERDYVPEDYIKLLCENFNFKDSRLLLKTYYGEEFKYVYEDSIFPDVKDIFSQLKDKFRLGVFSEGTNKYQTHKFRSMNLNEYFDKDLIFILDAKDNKEAVNKIPKGAIVVDDKERICEFLTEHRIKAIWLNKKDGRVSPNFQTIHNLVELPDYLQDGTL